MSLDELVSRYISSAEHVMMQMKVSSVCINSDTDDITRIVDCAKNYLEDAKYYKESGKLEVGLISVAYCEGLLDALRLLGAVRFEWPRRKKRGTGKSF